MDDLIRKIVKKCFPFDAPLFFKIVQDLLSKSDSHGTLESLALQCLLRKQQHIPILSACEKLLARKDLQEVLIEFRPFPEIVMFFLGRMIHEGSKICIHLHLDLFEVTLDNVSVVLVPDPVDKIHWALEFGKLAFSRSAERVGFRFEQGRGPRHNGDELVKQFKFSRPESSWAEAIAAGRRKIYLDAGEGGIWPGDRFYTHREFFGWNVYYPHMENRYCGYFVDE